MSETVNDPRQPRMAIRRGGSLDLTLAVERAIGRMRAVTRRSLSRGLRRTARWAEMTLAPQLRLIVASNDRDNVLL